ncbi:hypothetical protein BaRGS_00020032 [Batillaria attramentaria]|uniref:Uncharacterized protein n=1 Tax=Batillaria attramentaria TaxID=370345 RepID=A0ABD0KNX2_9CAEN
MLTQTAKRERINQPQARNGQIVFCSKENSPQLSQPSQTQIPRVGEFSAGNVAVTPVDTGVGPHGKIPESKNLRLSQTQTKIWSLCHVHTQNVTCPSRRSSRPGARERSSVSGARRRSQSTRVTGRAGRVRAGASAACHFLPNAA